MIIGNLLGVFCTIIFQGAITKRMTAIEEMAGMDVLCSDKTGTLTLNKLSVDKNLIEVSTIQLRMVLISVSFSNSKHKRR